MLWDITWWFLIYYLVGIFIWSTCKKKRAYADWVAYCQIRCCSSADKSIQNNFFEMVYQCSLFSRESSVESSCLLLFNQNLSLSTVFCSRLKKRDGCVFHPACPPFLGFFRVVWCNLLQSRFLEAILSSYYSSEERQSKRWKPLQDAELFHYRGTAFLLQGTRLTALTGVYYGKF